MSAMPGLAFGILTFGLFLGYLPVFYGQLKGLSPSPFGAVSSLISLAVLYCAVSVSERRGRDD
jgi:FSR family fosmidomycin resistance protein-like MFS transporter